MPFRFTGHRKTFGVWFMTMEDVGQAAAEERASMLVGNGLPDQYILSLSVILADEFEEWISCP